MSYKYSHSAAWRRNPVTKDVLVLCLSIGPLVVKDDINLASYVEKSGEQSKFKIGGCC